MNSLDERAAQFAADLGQTIRGVLETDVALHVVDAKQDRRIGPGPFVNGQFAKIPLPSRTAEPTVRASMKFEQTVRMNSKGLHMKVMSSTMALFVGTSDSQQPALRVDYDRAAVGRSAAHVHFHGQSPELSALRDADTRVVLRETSGIHFPLGNHRFRPSLEEFLRFLIEEGFTDGKPGWSAFLDERQADWLRIQAEAVADKNQDTVARILRANGWTVTPPAMR